MVRHVNVTMGEDTFDRFKLVSVLRKKTMNETARGLIEAFVEENKALWQNLKQDEVV